uniref:TDP43_N domain-containing protein n=1 Tax=Heterorhabditis bacteriophora TaxID=37862 RepID=A0A1I7W8R5_HETBA
MASRSVEHSTGIPLVSDIMMVESDEDANVESIIGGKVYIFVPAHAGENFIGTFCQRHMKRKPQNHPAQLSVHLSFPG